MQIELANLNEGRSSFAHVYEPADLDLADDRVKLSQPTSVTGKLRLSGARVRLEGTIDTQVTVECDRCLTAVALPVTTAFDLKYVTGKEYEAMSVAELTEDEMAVSVFDGEVIDVDEIVREQILLAVPARVLCRDDCRGFCSTCGKDLNLGDCGCYTGEIDPRWAALRKLTGS